MRITAIEFNEEDATGISIDGDNDLVNFQGELIISNAAPDKPPTCIGCKHLRKPFNAGHRCAMYPSIRYNIVTGKTKITRLEFAFVARLEEDMCGREARYYEPTALHIYISLWKDALKQFGRAFTSSFKR